MRHLCPALFQQLTPLIAQNAAELLVDFENPFGWRGHCHPDQTQFEVTPEAFLVLAQCRLGSFAFGHVLGHLHKTLEFAGFIFHGRHDDIGPESRSILPHAPTLFFKAASDRSSGLPNSTSRGS